MTPGEGLLWANHAVLLAIPALLPAVVVVAVVIHIARTDRRDESHQHDVAPKTRPPEQDSEPKT